MGSYFLEFFPYSAYTGNDLINFAIAIGLNNEKPNPYL